MGNLLVLVHTFDRVLEALSSPHARASIKNTFNIGLETIQRYKDAGNFKQADLLEEEIHSLLNKMLATLDKGSRDEIIN